jgi:hypothetical protein
MFSHHRYTLETTHGELVHCPHNDFHASSTHHGFHLAYHGSGSGSGFGHDEHTRVGVAPFYAGGPAVVGGGVC